MMSVLLKYLGTIGVVLLVGAAQVGCNSGARGGDETAAAPLDTTAVHRDRVAAPPDSMPRDTVGVAAETAKPARDSTVATPSVSLPQPEAAQDTPPSGAKRPSEQAGGGEPKVSQAEYEGWRQYSVNCARCHGQDVLPNPVAANLLISLAPGGPVESYEKFSEVVLQGRPERGMPAFKAILTPDQTKAVYAYVKGRAEKRIPPGRPASPST